MCFLASKFREKRAKIYGSAPRQEKTKKCVKLYRKNPLSKNLKICCLAAKLRG